MDSCEKRFKTKFLHILQLYFILWAECRVFILIQCTLFYFRRDIMDSFMVWVHLVRFHFSTLGLFSDDRFLKNRL